MNAEKLIFDAPYKLFVFGSTEKDSSRAKLRAFERLPVGWHFGEGVPLSNSARISAQLFLEKIENKGMESDVFPDVSGGVMVSVYWLQNVLDIFIEADGLATAVLDHDGMETELGNVDSSMLEDIVGVEVCQKKNFYDWFTQATTMREKHASSHWLSRIHPVEARLWSGVVAPNPRREAPVHISENFMTRESPATRRYISHSISKSLAEAHA